MGGKSSTSTQTQSIPQSVLDQYNSVNSKAAQVAQTPFQSYSGQFVAPVNSQQTAGINATNAAAGQAQAGYQQAGNTLTNAQNQASGYYNNATDTLSSGQAQGQGLAGASLGTLQGATNTANSLQGQGYNTYNNAAAAGQAYNGAASSDLSAGQAAGSAGIGQASNTLSSGTGAANSYNNASGQGLTNAYNGAQGYNQAAGTQYGSAQNAADPLQSAASGNYMAGQGVGAAANGLAGSQYMNAQSQGQAGNDAANSYYTQAGQSAQPYNQAATSQYVGAQSTADPLQSQASGNYTQGQGVGQALNGLAGAQYMGAQGAAQTGNNAAGQYYGAAAQSAQPYNQAASNQFTSAQGAASPLQGQSAYNLQSGLGTAQGYNQAATGLAGMGAQAVNASQIDGNSIAQYMSPYLQQVLGSESALLNQNNQQAMAGQTGNAISQGAFGGDRAGLAAANLSQQQQLANAQIYSGILNTGYNNALSTAQQQQGVNLSAGQANRAALQNASNQVAAIGNQGFNQNAQAASQQAALGNQQYNQAAQTGTNLQGLGNQLYAQNLGVGQAAQSLANQQYTQGSQTGQNIASLSNQAYNQSLNTGNAQAALANQQFGQANTTGQNLQSVGNQTYNQNLGLGQAQQGLSNQAFTQGSQTGQNVAALGNQAYNQAMGTGQAQAALGNQQFSQANTVGQNLQNLGQQQYAQGTGTAQALGSLGNQVFNQGLGASQQQAALGNQAYNQGLTSSQQNAALGQQQYSQGMGLGNAMTALGQQQYTQGANTAQQQLATGNQLYNQGLTSSQQQAALGQNVYNTGAATSAAQAQLGAGAQAAALQGAQAQIGAGTLQQQTQQAQNTAQYNQFLQQQSYPFQVAQFLANIAEGTGSLSGSTTTTTQPGGLFSDERLKSDAKQIGKTFDGQPIYSYKYKGDNRTQIGLMAQQVEKHRPDAVGSALGYKTVDYGKATEASAKRGHFAAGGVAGYDPEGMSQILQQQQAMFGNQPQGLGASGGSPYGGHSFVPAPSMQVHQLQKADPLQKQESPLAQAKQLGDTVSGLYDGGKSLLDKGSSMLDNHNLAVKTSPDDGGYLNFNADQNLPSFSARGGRIGYDAGGTVGPYGASSGLDIPQDKPNVQQLQSAAHLAPQQSDISKASDAASTVMDVMKVAAMFGAKNGGRIGYATGGTTKPTPALTAAQQKAQDAINAAANAQRGYGQNGTPTAQSESSSQAPDQREYNSGSDGNPYAMPDPRYTPVQPPAKAPPKKPGFASGGLADADIEPVDNDSDAVDPKVDGLGDAKKLFPVASKNDAPNISVHVAQAPISQPVLSGLGGAAPADPMAGLGKQAANFNPFSPPANGTQPNLDSIIQQLEQTGKNPNSTARGKYQIVDPTYIGAFRQMFPNKASMSDDDIKAFRNTPQGSALVDQMGPWLTHQNATALQKAGLPTDNTSMYMAHLLGAPMAKKVLQADPNTPLDHVLSAAPINANARILKGKTVGGLKEELADMVQRASSAVAKRQQQPVQAGLGFAKGGRIGYAPGGVPVDPDGTVQSNADPSGVTGSPDNQDAVSPDIAKQRGLAAAQDQVPASTQGNGLGDAANPPNQSFGDKVKGWGGKFVDWAKKPENLIPLLSGISAAGSAPTRNLLTALEVGAGGYSEGLKNVQDRAIQQQHADISQQNANTSQAQTALQMAQQARENAMAAFTEDAKTGGVEAPWKVVATGHHVSDAFRQQYLYLINSGAIDAANKLLMGGNAGVAKPNGGIGISLPDASLQFGPTSGTAAVAPTAAAQAVPSAPLTAGQAPPVASTSTPAMHPAVAHAPALDTSKMSAVQKAQHGFYGAQTFTPQFPDDSSIPEGQRYGDLVKKAQDLMSRDSAAGLEVTKRANGMLDGSIPVYDSNGQPSLVYQQWGQARKAAEAQIADQNAKKAQTLQQAQDFFPQYQQLSQINKSFSEVYKRTNSNVSSADLANLVGKVASLIPGLLPNQVKEFQNDIVTGNKDAALTVMHTIPDNLKNAPAAAMMENMAATAGTNLPAAAKYRLIVGNQGGLDQKNQFYKDLGSNAQNIQNIEKFSQDWHSEPANQTNAYVHRAAKNFDYFKGMTPQEMSEFPRGGRPDPNAPVGTMKTDAQGRILKKTANKQWVVVQ